MKMQNNVECHFFITFLTEKSDLIFFITIDFVDPFPLLS